MAEFCWQCTEDLGMPGNENDYMSVCSPGQFAEVICEGCGCTTVDCDGRCVAPDCLRKHGPHLQTLNAPGPE